MHVRPKKSLGQHFLHDKNIAARITSSLDAGNYSKVLEIGPGKGILTGLLLERSGIDLFLVEIDRESVAYLKEKFPGLDKRMVEGDILRLDLGNILQGPFGIIGNFPYYISSQIFFRVLECRHQVQEVVCMVQKEVAERICSGPGNKTYGILSVLLQAFYKTEYLFTVGEKVFVPPPKVKSAVLRLKRNDRETLPCNEELFFRLVKTGFNQRRKTLRNSLKTILLPLPVTHPLLDKRPEQLGTEEFFSLARWVEETQKT